MIIMNSTWGLVPRECYKITELDKQTIQKAQVSLAKRKRN